MSADRYEGLVTSGWLTFLPSAFQPVVNWVLLSSFIEYIKKAWREVNLTCGWKIRFMWIDIKRKTKTLNSIADWITMIDSQGGLVVKSYCGLPVGFLLLKKVNFELCVFCDTFCYYSCSEHFNKEYHKALAYLVLRTFQSHVVLMIQMNKAAVWYFFVGFWKKYSTLFFSLFQLSWEAYSSHQLSLFGRLSRVSQGSIALILYVFKLSLLALNDQETTCTSQWTVHVWILL